MLSGRGLCDELIARGEESYRLWCVVVCDLETSRMGAPYIYIYIYDISSLRVNRFSMFDHLFVTQKRILIKVGIVYTESCRENLHSTYVFSCIIGFNFLCKGSTC